MKDVHLLIVSIALVNSAHAAFLNNHQHINRVQLLIGHRSSLSLAQSYSNDKICDEDGKNDRNSVNQDGILRRRNFLQNSFTGLATFSLGGWVNTGNNIQRAHARGLVQFPCTNYNFLNTYHFLRAGESLLEEEGVWSTNPLFLTNQEAKLSSKGIEQVENACQRIRADGQAPTIVRYSLAASAIDSSNIVGKELKVGRDRLVPEFNFLDPRAIGSWDMSNLDTTLSAVWAMDADEAGKNGLGARPPSNEDGTPHETLADQVVRLQQLISVLETQYSGDTVLLIFPDGTGPALLTCLIGGIPLNRVHELEYRSGEIRLDVNYDTAHAYLDREPSEEYKEIIAKGRVQLRDLRENEDAILNVRDQQYAQELQKEQEKRDRLAEEQMLRKEEERRKREAKEALLQKTKEERQKAKEESLARQKAKADESTAVQNVSPTATSEADSPDSGMLAVGGMFVAAIGSASMAGKKEEEPSEPNDGALTLQNITEDFEETEEKSGTEESIVPLQSDTANQNDDDGVPKLEINLASLESSLDEAHGETRSLNLENESTSLQNDIDQSNENGEYVDEDDSVLRDTKAKDHADTAVPSSPNFDDLFKPPAPAWDPNEDDGSQAWLGSLSELMKEEDEEIMDEETMDINGAKSSLD